MKQIRLNPGALLNAQGALIESGYATYLVKTYERAAIKASKWKIKEWDYYLIYASLIYGFGDTQDATENMIFWDGTSHKLEGVTFKIPQNDDGSDDYMKPWLFTTNNNRFEAIFTPILDRAAYTSLAIFFSDQHQVFGTFDGIAILDDGTKVIMKDFLGFAEKVRNKW